ncbi:MAG: hypothetical protein NVS1B2_19330 [Vulcanimicrobiaceae bacterium]
MKLDADLLAIARYDVRGVPVAGREAEFAALHAAGARDLAAARIYEGHVNALGLIARFGTAAQRARAEDDAAAGRLFGVWNTQDADGVTFVRDGDRVRLAGAKSWASGARFVTRPIVTAADAGGRPQMFVVPMDRVRATVADDATWEPLGMAASASVRVSFDDAILTDDDAIGSPGDYLCEPWFSGGALRFVAVQTGAIERLVHETFVFLIDRERDGDAIQTARAAEMTVAAETARLWTGRGMRAWQIFDANSQDDAAAAAVVEAVDGARVAVERAAFDVLERAMRAVGARGLVAPQPFAELLRDLQMYLRQPASDAIVQRVGHAAFAAARSARTSGSATSTGTGA